MKIFITLFAYFAFTIASAKTALIFNGAGVCNGCAESVATLLLKKKFNIIYVNEQNLSLDKFKNIDLYVQPGGSDDITETTNALTSYQIGLINSYVNKGGHYLGICAGAYLAAKFADKNKQIRAFDLIEIDEIDQEAKTDKPFLISILNTKDQAEKKAYYQAGPHFGKTAPANVKILSYYKKSKNISSRLSSFGKGSVLLIGPHFEADEEWYKEDGLSLKHGLNLDYFNELISELIKD